MDKTVLTYQLTFENPVSNGTERHRLAEKSTLPFRYKKIHRKTE